MPRTKMMMISAWLLLSIGAMHSRTKQFKRIQEIPIPKNLENEDYLIHTPGCQIPNYVRSIRFKETFKRANSQCSPRIVIVKKISESRIEFQIEHNMISLAKYIKCCYKFAKRSDIAGKEDTRIRYTKCKPFQHGDNATLEEEYVAVYCDVKLLKPIEVFFVYFDAYLILKKKLVDEIRLPTKEHHKTNKPNWNVLVVGIDTMSRARAYHSLPNSVKFLKDQGWLDYRGYNKVAWNTFPNVMATLTGLNPKTISKTCYEKVEECQKILIWSKFKDAGYVTAYGEDNSGAPDTFSPYGGFSTPPTDHYTRPFFLMGEKQLGNTVCMKTKPSAEHLLDYIEQFAEAYQNDSFFGFFWLNSIAHHPTFLPTQYDQTLVYFFQELRALGALNRTFVFFLSNHGIRYGEMRNAKEFYYEERHPMLFIWVPLGFRKAHRQEYYNLQLNQYRLTTPYDVHMTLWNLIKMTDRDVDIIPPDECLHRGGLLQEISPTRTCEDARIEMKWCTCGTTTEAQYVPEINEIVTVALTHINQVALSRRTRRCTACKPLQMSAIKRMDYLQNGNSTYYVMAVRTSPGKEIYEINLKQVEGEFKVIVPTYTISGYGGYGWCVLRDFDKYYCICETLKNCK